LTTSLVDDLAHASSKWIEHADCSGRCWAKRSYCILPDGQERYNNEATGIMQDSWAGDSKGGRYPQPGLFYPTIRFSLRAAPVEAKRANAKRKHANHAISASAIPTAAFADFVLESHGV
jgi:hypothetical protein